MKERVGLSILKVLLASVASLAALFVLTKLIGKRQISQLTMFDYVNGITIGSIAAEMATNIEDSILEPLTAMVVYATVTALVSYIGTKSLKFRDFLNGQPEVLYYDGKLYRRGFKRANIDLSEFLMRCRNAGYFDLTELRGAVIESNGIISFLPSADSRPATSGDMGISAQDKGFTADVILDGRVMSENLRRMGKNEEWLNKELKNQGASSAREVFLATCDENGVLSVYKNLESKTKTNVF